MGAFVLRRVLYSLVIIFGASVAAFSLIRIVPGDPARIMAPNAPEEQIAQIRHELGYDRPLPVQFVSFVGDAVRGDFGRSAFLKEDVSAVIAHGLPYTLLLAVSALIIALTIGVSLGTLAAMFQNRLIDRIALGIAVLGQSMPGFWFALVLILIFSVHLRLLPALGYKGPQYLILPAIALAISLLATLLRSTRLVMIDVLGQDFIKAARARHLTRRSDRSPCLPEHPRADPDDCRRSARLPPRRRGGDRIDLQLSRDRPDDAQRRITARLSGRAGGYDIDGGRFRIDQHHHRHLIRVPRSPHP